MNDSGLVLIRSSLDFSIVSMLLCRNRAPLIIAITLIGMVKGNRIKKLPQNTRMIRLITVMNASLIISRLNICGPYTRNILNASTPLKYGGMMSNGRQTTNMTKSSTVLSAYQMRMFLVAMIRSSLLLCSVLLTSLCRCSIRFFLTGNT
jgi:hypothetical protein